MINNILIGINLVVFVTGLVGRPEAFHFLYGIVPRRYTDVNGWLLFSPGAQIFPFLSYMFIHGGFWHLLGNMWSLYIFGDNIEDHFGSVKYLLFYLACGVFAAMAHIVINAASAVPTIGASGAVAGVMGAYFLLFPGSRILSLIPLFFIPFILEIPAFIFLGAWFAMQFFNAAGQSGAGVAWWAHVGGFLFGLVMVKLVAGIPMPEKGRKLRQLTARRKSPGIQVVRVASEGLSFGHLNITPYEAVRGARKLVNITMGLKSKMYRVSVPSGIRSGKMLRLRGLGGILPNGKRGDLMLEVIVRGDAAVREDGGASG